MEIERCPVSWSGVHKFEARYETKPIERDVKIRGYYTAEEMTNMMSVKVYVYDICTRCGLTIHRQK